MKKIVLTLLAVCTTAIAAQAQDNSQQAVKAFSHLDLGVSLGTTGVGIDVEAPISRSVAIRTGFEAIPRFEKRMHFDVESFDEQGQMISNNLDRLSSTMYDLTGYKIDGTIDMVGKPTMWNYKLLVDVKPFRNKNWHITAGFHWGPAKVAEAVNAIEDSPSLFSIGMYNHLYNNAWEADHGNVQPLITWTNSNGEEDGVALSPEVMDKLLETGRMGIHVGEYRNQYIYRQATDEGGNPRYDENGYPIMEQTDEHAPYIMEPDENSMVRARVKTNSFRPYLGFGYGGKLSRKDDRYRISFDAGLLFWGGTPDIITHDGTNLSKDVQNISGKVGDYVDLIKGVKAYPVLNLRITRRLF